MKVTKSNFGDIEFYYREGLSDLKAFEEVIQRDAYQKRNTTIQAGQHWMDCGGNVGAFTLLACSLGAQVTVYEPDPFNCEMIEKNLDLNGFTADIKQAALVHDNTPQVTLFIGNNGNVWRNSIVKRWNDQAISVPALNFDDEAQGKDCCKMDIEGAEMPILETTDRVFEQLVYEWSFDVDPSLRRIWKVLDRQKAVYDVQTAWSTVRYEQRDYEVWQDNWFPACTMVHCHL